MPCLSIMAKIFGIAIALVLCSKTLLRAGLYDGYFFADAYAFHILWTPELVLEENRESRKLFAQGRCDVRRADSGIME